MRIIITGGSWGLGAAIIDAILSEVEKRIGNTNDITIFNLDKNPVLIRDGTYNITCDISNYSDVTNVKDMLYKFSTLPYDILINCAGINEINFLEDLEEEEWDKVMDTNAKGIYLVTKTFLDLLKGGTILNIVSNASHMPMTSSLAYNASKGAAAIMTLQMARELGPRGITVFGISPNKLAGTGMSNYIDQRVVETRGWTPEYAKEYQLKALPAGEETDPKVLAEFIAFLLSSKQRHKYLAGTIIPYGK